MGFVEFTSSGVVLFDGLVIGVAFWLAWVVCMWSFFRMAVGQRGFDIIRTIKERGLTKSTGVERMFYDRCVSLFIVFHFLTLLLMGLTVRLSL